MRRWLLLLAVSLTGGIHATEASLSSIEGHYDKLNALNFADTGTDNELKGRQIGGYYDAHVARLQKASALASRSDAEMDFLFRSALLASYYTFDERYMDDMRRDLAELSRRGVAPTQSLKDFYQALVAYRHFEEAADFRQTHPSIGVPALPVVYHELPQGYAGPTGLYLVESGTQRSFHRKALPLSASSARVVVISHPKCHFSARAVADIERSPVLLGIFQEHSTWITPQDGDIDVPNLAAWNHAHKIPPTAVTYRQSEWPMFHNWATPTFYFFKDGKLVREVSGWPPGGNEEALRAALREVGLLDQDGSGAG